jgi:transposase
MAQGKRRNTQQAEWIATTELPKSPGHPFYVKLNQLLAEAGFDAWVEALCEACYAETMGRPSIPPGVYFRMLLIGYFEGIDSQRGIAWRCSDSRSLCTFLGLGPSEESPDHSSLTRIRKRLPIEVHEEVFRFVLQLAEKKNLLKGKTIAIDSTTLEANAAMKSIVRKESGEDYKAYLRKLAQEAGIEDPSDDDLRRFDKGRKDKTLSNEDWESKTDPDSRIARMKDNTTHLAYKAEHAVDLGSDMVVSAEVCSADRSDHDTLKESVVQAQKNLILAGSEVAVEELVADKGYHKAENLAWAEGWGVRTYIPEREEKQDRRWTDKPAEQKKAVYANRRRVQGDRGKRLGRLRSEYVERSFAHVCETGEGRRTWLRGLIEVSKRYLIQVAARNLGVMMRKMFGMGTPRSLQDGLAALSQRIFALVTCCIADAVARWSDGGNVEMDGSHRRVLAPAA